MEKPTFCTSCGAALKIGARFCETCGKPVMVAAAEEVKAAVPAQTSAPVASWAVGQRSPDGKWWWDGTQWVLMPQAMAPAIAPAVARQVKKGRGKFIWLGLGVAVVVLVGILFLASKVPTASQGGLGVGAGPYYEHFNCQGASACMTGIVSNASSYEAYANNGNTGIDYDFLAMIVCQQVANADAGKGLKTWCSTSKNPGDTGP